MPNLHSVFIVLVAAGVTMLLRFGPFLIFSGNKETPAFITYLGKVLPYAIMGMLLIYCLKDVSILEAPHGIPELLAIGLTAILHIWKRNTLISMICGTIFYMVLIQVVF